MEHWTLGEERRAKMKLGTYITVCMFLGTATFSTGCRKDLCYNHDEHSFSVKHFAVVEWEQEWEQGIKHDWKQKWPWGLTYGYDDLRPGKAERITAISYVGGEIKGQTSFSTDGGRLPLSEGENDILFYNSDTEKIVFNGFSVSESSQATTRTISRASLPELHAGERTIGQPDALYGCFMGSHMASETKDTVNVNVVMHPLTYIYVVRCEITKGRKYVAKARGALAGMAENVYINDGHTGEKCATILFDFMMTEYGAEAYVSTFGVPNFKNGSYTRADGQCDPFTLNVELLLKNGRIKSKNINISDQIDGQPRGGVIYITGIEISDSEGADDGGFDVNVGDWGEYIDIPVDLK